MVFSKVSNINRSHFVVLLTFIIVSQFTWDDWLSSHCVLWYRVVLTYLLSNISTISNVTSKKILNLRQLTWEHSEGHTSACTLTYISLLMVLTSQKITLFFNIENTRYCMHLHLIDKYLGNETTGPKGQNILASCSFPK